MSILGYCCLWYSYFKLICMFFLTDLLGAFSARCLSHYQCTASSNRSFSSSWIFAADIVVFRILCEPALVKRLLIKIIVNIEKNVSGFDMCKMNSIWANTQNSKCFSIFLNRLLDIHKSDVINGFIYITSFARLRFKNLKSLFSAPEPKAGLRALLLYAFVRLSVRRYFPPIFDFTSETSEENYMVHIVNSIRLKMVHISISK